MSLLHILRSEPDEKTKKLIDIISEGEETEVFKLYDSNVDYDELIDLIFENDRVFSWI